MRSVDAKARPRPNPWVTVVLAVVLTLLAGCVGFDLSVKGMEAVVSYAD
jgi:hypothetical protein